ncbi:MAG: hypothetical protein ACO1TE_23915 [Prosthecobacter sp.]
MHELTTSPLPTRLAKALHQELMEGERVVWADVPVTGTAIRGSWAVFFMGVFFTFMTCKSLEQEIAKPSFDWGDLLFPGLLACFTLRMLLEPLLAWRTAKRTLYVVTNQRAIILVAGGRDRTVRSFQDELLASFELREKSNGHGSIIFQRDAYRTSKGTTHHTEVGFIGLRNVRAVDALLRATHRNLFAGQASAPVGKN